MNRTRFILTASLAGCLAIAVVALAIPFFASLGVSAKAIADLPRVAMPALQPGEFAFVPHPVKSRTYPADLLMVRDKAGHLAVWLAPKVGHAYAMPDLKWQRLGRECQQFTPDFTTGTIACRDKGLELWFQQAFQWSLDGKNLSGKVEDMVRVAGMEAAGDFVLSSGRSPQ